MKPFAYPHDHERAGLRDYLPSPRRRRRWPRLIAIAMAGAAIAAAAVTLAAAEPVALQVRPRVMLQRGDIRIEARVPRDVRNQILAIAWSSDVGSAGVTQRPLEGEDAPVLHVLELRSQPAANYRFVATVYDRAGKIRGRTEATVQIPDIQEPVR
ncbi:MAG TPA: hypothetical protein VN803_06815 [Gemmatimonadales bacterium]|nr:hypothetical protein [Gemmatimonadales bacterium]